MMTPYKNVIRLHLLIFFFAFASFAKLDKFLGSMPWSMRGSLPVAVAETGATVAQGG